MDKKEFEEYSERKVYSINAVAELFGVTRDTVKRMILDGRLSATKENRRYLISEESLIRLAKGERKA